MWICNTFVHECYLSVFLCVWYRILTAVGRGGNRKTTKHNPIHTLVPPMSVIALTKPRMPPEYDPHVSFHPISHWLDKLRCASFREVPFPYAGLLNNLIKSSKNPFSIELFPKQRTDKMAVPSRRPVALMLSKKWLNQRAKQWKPIIAPEYKHTQ